MRRTRTGLFCVLSLSIGAVCAAQSSEGGAPSSTRRPDAFGTPCCDILQIPAQAFTPVDSGFSWASTQDGYLYVTGGIIPATINDVFAAPVSLPSGARIRQVDLFYSDTSASNISVTLRRVTGTDSSTLQELVTVASSGNTGEDRASSGPIDVTVDNDVSQFTLLIQLNVAGAALKFRSVAIHWQRQISPAPLSATFGDVPTSHLYFRAIEALNASGITQGCGNGNFCPQLNVTRGEMAAFLARALGLQFSYPQF